MPELEQLRKEYEPRGIRFIAISIEPDRARVSATARRLQIQIKVAVARREVLGPFGVNQVPSTVFIREDGTIIAAASGPRKRKFLEERTRELLR